MFGGFQPIMRAPADFTYVIPDKLSSAAAAPLLCAGESTQMTDPTATVLLRWRPWLPGGSP